MPNCPQQDNHNHHTKTNQRNRQKKQQQLPKSPPNTTKLALLTYNALLNVPQEPLQDTCGLQSTQKARRNSKVIINKKHKNLQSQRTKKTFNATHTSIIKLQEITQKETHQQYTREETTRLGLFKVGSAR